MRAKASQHLAEAHFTLGLALLCSGRREAAEEAYETGLQRAREWGDSSATLRTSLEDACRALEKQIRARGDLACATEILSRLRTARDALVAQWPAA